MRLFGKPRGRDRDQQAVRANVPFEAPLAPDEAFFAIGDVHGCLRPLGNLLLEIDKRDSAPKIVCLGDMIDRKTRSEAWTMIIETRIDEAVSGVVKTEFDDRSRKGAVAGAVTAIGGSGIVAGAEGNRTRRNQVYAAERTKVRIKNTLVITARQVQLTEADALPAIEERLERIIPEILP